MTIQIFTTGGTIDKCYSTEQGDFVVGPPILLAAFREANVGADHVVEPLLQKDSVDITTSDRNLIRDAISRCPSSRIIVTHGTDTMVETAKALVGFDNKTIVLTGAMQPAAFKVTDAMFNLGYAFAAVQRLPAGVYIAIHGTVFDPNRVRKNEQKDRFEIIE